MTENLIVGLLFIILSLGTLFMILIMIGGVFSFLP
ncbi:cbb3-type cytochrome oxidase subunit 3 [Bacillus fengqiuensis]|nr:cbb3-type cytochrome oxidase subunit 3 [Bacillus fengqiuensis]